MAKRRDYHILEELTKPIGPSGFEQKIQKLYARLMRPLVDNIYTDKLGNCYAEINGNPELPNLMFSAHADNVGFMIKYIDDLGFLFTEDILEGSVDHRMMPGTKVVVLGRKSRKKVPGKFIPVIPIHKTSDLNEAIDREDLAVDIGAKSRYQAERYVDIGDYVVWEADPTYTSLNGHKNLESANLDNRISLFCMYRVAKELNKIKRKCNVTFVSTVSEETYGDSAARVAAVNVKPDIAVIIDALPATDQIRSNNEDTIGKRYGYIGINKGVVVSRGKGADDNLFLYLEDLCLGDKRYKNKIPYQIAIGCDGTDSPQVQVAGEGAKTALISIPVRYCHTPIETLCLNDVESTIQLCTDFYKGVSRGKFK